MCPRTVKNTNTYNKHIKKEHGDRYAAYSCVAIKYLISAYTQTPDSMDKDDSCGGGPDSASAVR